MTIIRVRFSRGEELKFISHLDMIRVFERALRRAGISVAYSEGFNPRPKMTFALPLSVGVTSSAEYADFEVDGTIAPEEFREKLNQSLPSGLNIMDAAVLEDRAGGSLMATVKSASYDVKIEIQKGADIGRAVSEFMGKSYIGVKKETKKGLTEINIRQMILELEAETAHTGEHILHMILSAGSIENLKPELVVSALSEHLGNGLICKSIHRTGLYVDKEARLTPMG